jgi:hypothetical protein
LTSMDRLRRTAKNRCSVELRYSLLPREFRQLEPGKLQLYELISCSLLKCA